MLEVIDRDGTKHNLAWLQADYGSGLVYHQAPDGMYPRFELRQVFITEGPTVLRFTVICADGTPCVGQPVAYSFPSISSPSSDLPAVPNGADKAHWITRACLERCDPRGGHEFQIGKDSWTKGLAAASSGATALQKAFAADPNFGFYSLRRTPGLAASGVVGRGPYAVQVISPSTWSEGLDGIGWLGGTNHRGPCEFVFREVLSPNGGGGGGGGGGGSTGESMALVAAIDRLTATLREAFKLPNG